MISSARPTPADRHGAVLTSNLRATDLQGQPDVKRESRESSASNSVFERYPTRLGAKFSTTSPPPSRTSDQPDAGPANGDSGKRKRGGSLTRMGVEGASAANGNPHVNLQNGSSVNGSYGNYLKPHGPHVEDLTLPRRSVAATSKSRTSRSPRAIRPLENGINGHTSRSRQATPVEALVERPFRTRSPASTHANGTEPANSVETSSHQHSHGANEGDHGGGSNSSRRHVIEEKQLREIEAAKTVEAGLAVSPRATTSILHINGEVLSPVQNGSETEPPLQQLSDGSRSPMRNNSSPKPQVRNKRHFQSPMHGSLQIASLGNETLAPNTGVTSTTVTLGHEYNADGDNARVLDDAKTLPESAGAARKRYLKDTWSIYSSFPGLLCPSMEAAESVLDEHMRSLHDDHESLVKLSLFQARCSGPVGTRSPPGQGFDMNLRDSRRLSEGGRKSLSPFSNLTPNGTPGKKLERTTTRVNFKLSHHGKQVARYKDHPVAEYRSTQEFLPPYTSLLTLRTNFNVENDKKLISWPYLELSDKERKELDKELLNRYSHGNPDQRANTVARAQHINHHRATVVKFLDEMDCEPGFLLVYLLDPKPNAVLRGASDAQVKAWRHRDKYFKGGKAPDRDDEKWKKIFGRHVGIPFDSMVVAAVSCAAFDRVSAFGLWHYVKDLGRTPTQPNTLGEARPSIANYISVACRICQMHSCPYHGEITERPSGTPVIEDDEDNSPDDDDFDRDDVEPPDINHKQLVKAPARTASLDLAHKDFARNPEEALRSVLKTGHQHHLAGKPYGPRKGWHYWTHSSQAGDIHGRQSFYPCNHEGSCEAVRCRCFREHITCEKTCGCSLSCERRFRGCTCAQAQKACYKNAKCDCWQLGRECDPDLCGSCGAAEVLDPVRRREVDAVHGKCWNVGLQRNVPKRTKIGKSEVAGYGLFAAEPIKRDEYIGEYKGEVIMQEEADRRGTIHHYQPRAYLSQLNRHQEIDGTHAGCKMRFLNNSSKDPGQNCYRALLLSGTVTRMAMFARRDIQVGEELFFDYGYSEKEKKRKRFREPELEQSITTLFKAKKRKMERNKAKRALDRAAVDGILREPGIGIADLEGDHRDDSADTSAGERSPTEPDYVEPSDTDESSEDETYALGPLPAMHGDDSDDSDYDSSATASRQPKKRGRRRKLSP